MRLVFSLFFICYTDSKNPTTSNQIDFLKSVLIENLPSIIERVLK